MLTPSDSVECMQVLHGALLGTAELLLALQAASFRPEAPLLRRAAAVAPGLAAARLFRGRGGELLRAGVCRCELCRTRDAVTRRTS